MLVEGDGVFWRFLNEGKSLWVFIPPYDSVTTVIAQSPGRFFREDLADFQVEAQHP
jgi:hypothetical protein